MSRLDFFTIFIIFICVFAIGLLFYYATDIFKKKQEVPVEAVVTDTSTLAYPGMEEDTMNFTDGDTTDYWRDSDKMDESYNDGQEGGASSGLEDNWNASDEDENRASKSSAPDEPAEASIDDGGQEYPDGDDMASSGDYLVLGGTFVKMHHAKQRLKALQKKGYAQAQIVLFDRGKYAVVLVDRFDDIDLARDLVEEMKAKGLEAALYKKR